MVQIQKATCAAGLIWLFICTTAPGDIQQATTIPLVYISMWLQGLQIGVTMAL